MKTVTVYEAIDGTQFNKQIDCQFYETIISRVKNIMSSLKSNKEVCDNVAVKQDITVVKNAFNSFLLLCGEVIPEYKKVFSDIILGKGHISLVGRLLDDYNEFPILYKTYCRFASISKDSGIEYNQPYYALNESEFEGKTIN